MKQKSFLKKLSLKKETIASLNDLEKSKVVGGKDDTTTITRTGCPTEWPCPSEYIGCNTDFLHCHNTTRAGVFCV
jgi:hypothetical protein